METIILQHIDSSIRDIVTLTLEDAFEVIALEYLTSESAILINTQKPAVIILDFILDGKEALGSLALIKRIDQTIPVVAISCNINISQTFRQYGFDGFVEKPFDLNTLREVIIEIANAKHLSNMQK